MDLTPEQRKARVKEIREGNDLLRTTFFSFLGKVQLSVGVRNNPLREEVITAVREFNQFNSGNDPYGEHDFGSVEIEGPEGKLCEKRGKRYEKFSFKIDYYDLNFEFGADPYTQPYKRVLTIREEAEY